MCVLDGSPKLRMGWPYLGTSPEAQSRGGVLGVSLVAQSMGFMSEVVPSS